ncbi:MAG: hypothetical protein RLZZ447_947 [Verrucomicrobiota bacterium]
MSSDELFRAGQRWLARVLLLCLGVGPASGETLRVATWNVANYGPTARITGAGYRSDYPKPESEKAALRSVLHHLNADVVALQEMGPPAYLEELARDLAREGLVYAHRAVAADDEPRRNAILSRVPLHAVRTHATLEFPYLGRTTRLRRGLLEATLLTSAGELTLVVLHLKSPLSNDPRDPRADGLRRAEAGAVRGFLLERFPDPHASRFLLLGDCNEGPTGPALLTLRRRGRTELLRLAPAVDDRGDSWTHHYRRGETYARVDLILYSPAAAPWIAGPGEILDGPEVRSASDHRPVVLRLVPLPISGG